MKDMIDKRNEKEQIRKSIVKFWNVNYIPYSQEKTADLDVEKKAECSDALAEVKEQENLYNAATGAYSGAYGTGEIEDEAQREWIGRILQERNEEVSELIRENSDESFRESK